MNRAEGKIRLSKIMERFIALSCTHLPDDVVEALKNAANKETDDMQKSIYDAYFRNLDQAKTLNRPCCQDTGILHFYITAGSDFPYLSVVEESLKIAVKNATQSVPLRQNAVNFFEEKNTGDNTGQRTPWIHWDLVPDNDKLDIITFFSGAGCSLPGNSKVFKPSDGYETIVQAVFDTVSDLGLNACPPLVIGVGLGTNVENAAELSKKAYLRPIGSRNENKKAAALEDALLQGLNNMGIGAQGLRGNTAALDVHIEASARHTANIAVAVNVSCYTHRRGVIHFDRNLSYKVDNYINAYEYMNMSERESI